MANVSYLRSPAQPRANPRARGSLGAAPGRRRRTPWMVAGVLGLVLVVLAVVAVVFSTSQAKLTASSGALAKIDLPLGGGSVKKVVATTGIQNQEKFVRLRVEGDPTIYPAGKIPAGEKLTITAVVRRPGWIAWLAGKTQTLTRTVVVPRSQIHNRFITLTRGGALQIHFSAPVRTLAYGTSARHVRRHTFARARRVVTVPHRGTAGTTYVAATVNPWETASATSVSYFPAGTRATAVAQPAAGSTIRSDTPITLTFSKPVATVLGSHRPAVSPAGAGSWHTISSHAIRFTPAGYGYGLGQRVSVALPAGVRLDGAGQTAGASTGTWNVPSGSTVRLQQLLAQLGYLPLNVDYTSGQPADTLAAQENAAEAAPAATFSFQYADTPAGLKSQWLGPDTAGVMTKGAMMRFQYDHDLQVTGYEDAETWRALFTAVIKHQRNTFGYTFVSVSENLPESLFVWHSGKTVLSNIPVNTGVAGAATATGTFPVFEHLTSTTMIGTDVDGTHYDDPDIRWVSYFNGGDALHAYTRNSYGSPQSNGCVEMDEPDAASVFPYTPVGTLVQVNS